MDAISTERVDERVAVVRIDRPERRNALDSAALAALLAELGALAAEPEEDLGAVVLSSSSDRAFCAGADVTEELDDAGGVARMDAFAELYARLSSFPAPVVCCCVGDVLGAGAEIAAAADLRVAGDNLRMGWVGARLGVPVGPARLVPLVGLATASELLLTARIVGAREALALGLAHRLAPAGAAEAEALALARATAALPGARAMKALLHAGEGTEARVATENDGLMGWQRTGAGLPRMRR